MNHFGPKMSLLDNYKHSTEDLYAKYLQFTSVMLEEYSAIEVAAIMATQALSLYRSCMSEEDYQKIVQNIFDRKNQIKTF